MRSTSWKFHYLSMRPSAGNHPSHFKFNHNRTQDYYFPKVKNGRKKVRRKDIIGFKGKILSTFPWPPLKDSVLICWNCECITIWWVKVTDRIKIASKLNIRTLSCSIRVALMISQDLEIYMREAETSSVRVLVWGKDWTGHCHLGGWKEGVQDLRDMRDTGRF
jgi:hypothetical protein